MKRTPVLFVFACAIVSLSLFSCDAMFSSNIFGGMTHKKLTTDSVQSQTPSELDETLDSDYNRQQLADDPELKQAVLDTLETSYDDPDETDYAEGQTAAILAADIIIGTDPAASQLAAGALGAIESISDLMDSTGSETPPSADDISDIMADILPLDIQTALEGGSATPPESFVGMISSFLAADDAFSALNAGLGADGTYLADVTEEEQVEIAFNALVSGFVSIIEIPDGEGTVPDPTDEQIAQALWSAMTDPQSAADRISIAADAFDNLTGEGGIGNILAALPFDFGTAE